MTINDSRLLHNKELLSDVLADMYDMSRGTFADREDSERLRALVRDQRKVLLRLIELMDPELFTPCRTHHHLGATCYRQKDHCGFHRSEWGQAWTDESDRQSADAIAKSLDGRRD
jgi:hypothetical protein